MSKRDSVTAHLPDLAIMAEEMQVDSRHAPSASTTPAPPPAYAMETPTLPGPSSSSGLSHQHHIDPRDLPFIMGDQPPLQPTERRTQTVHTIKFQRIRHGSAPAELKIEETDVAGFSKIKTLEHYFFGILNHCSSYYYSWRNSVYMANYWRRFFNIDEIPEDPHDQVDNTDPDMLDDRLSMPDYSEPGTDPGPIPYTTSHGHQQIPLHLVHMALVLDSVLSQVDPATNPEVAHLHQRMASGSIRDFSSLNAQELTDLATVLAITAHQLARQAAPNPPAHEVALPQQSYEGL